MHPGSFLILEGEDDHRFWRPRVTPRECELIIGDGKPNVEGAILRLDTRNFSGALGLVDDDFDRLQDRASPSPNLLATDAHDLECLLLRSEALERVLAEYGDPGKIRGFEDTHGGTVRDALLARGLVHLRANTDNINPILPLGNILPQMNANQRKWVDIDSSLSTVPDRFASALALICG